MSIPDAKIRSLVLCHALTGYDTTSGIHNIGKTKLFKSQILETEADAVKAFYEATSSPADIIAPGERRLLSKQKSSSLDHLRYLMYKESLSSNSIKKKSRSSEFGPVVFCSKFPQFASISSSPGMVRFLLIPVSMGGMKKKDGLSQSPSKDQLLQQMC